MDATPVGVDREQGGHREPEGDPQLGRGPQRAVEERAVEERAGVRDPSGARASVTMDGRPFPIRPHHCFACGSTNVDGIGLPLHIEGDSCWTEIVLPDRFEGWEGIAHGGIVCTILDEVMAWALAHRDAWGLTARMSVDFRRPVPIGIALRGEGRLVRARRRLMETEARLLDARSGEILATAEAVYVAAPPDRKAELKRRYGFDDPPGGPRRLEAPG